jgi:hypothetical protein
MQFCVKSLLLIVLAGALAGPALTSARSES